MPIIRRDETNEKIFRKYVVQEDIDDYIGQAGDGAQGPPGAAGEDGAAGIPGPDGAPGFGASVIANPSFEFSTSNIPDDWYDDDDSTSVYTSDSNSYFDGEYSLKLVTDSGDTDSIISKSFRLRPGTEYYVTFFGMQGDTPTQNAGLTVYINTSSTYAIHYQPDEGTPAQIEMSPVVSGIASNYSTDAIALPEDTGTNNDWGWYVGRFTTGASENGWASLRLQFASDYPNGTIIRIDDVDCRRKLNIDELFSDIDLLFPNLNASINELTSDFFLLCDAYDNFVVCDFFDLCSGFENLSSDFLSLCGTYDNFVVCDFFDLCSGFDNFVACDFFDLCSGFEGLVIDVDDLTSSHIALSSDFTNLCAGFENFVACDFFNLCSGFENFVACDFFDLCSEFENFVACDFFDLCSGFENFVICDFFDLCTEFEGLSDSHFTLCNSFDTLNQNYDDAFIFPNLTGFDAFSRGGLQRQNLIINGNGIERDTTNWESVTPSGSLSLVAGGVPTDSNAYGHFYHSTTVSGMPVEIYTTEYIPIDTTKAYSLTAFVKNTNSSNDESIVSVGIKCYVDVAGTKTPLGDKNCTLDQFDIKGYGSLDIWIKAPLEGTPEEGLWSNSLVHGVITGTDPSNPNKFAPATTDIRVFVKYHETGTVFEGLRFTDIKLLNMTDHTAFESDGSLNFQFDTDSTAMSILGNRWIGETDFITVGQFAPSEEDERFNASGIYYNPSGYTMLGSFDVMKSTQRDLWPASGAGENECCFLPGTKILMANGQQIKIEEVEVGSKVLSFDIDKLSFDTSTVEETEAPIREGYFIINEGLLKITNEHPVYANNRWIKAENLIVGDLIKGVDEDIPIETISYIKKQIQTYNIKWAKSTNNFFANRCLVHNKHPGVQT